MIGMDPDSQEDAYKIIEHLLTEAEKMGIEKMDVNEKVLGHSSRVQGPLDRMKIYSTWGMKSAAGEKNYSILKPLFTQPVKGESHESDRGLPFY